MHPDVVGCESTKQRLQHLFTSNLIHGQYSKVFSPRKTNTEVPTGLYILPDFKFWAVFGRRGCLNKSLNLSIKDALF